MGRLAVVGAGVAGLAAAYEAGRQQLETVVFEASDRVGGRIQASPFAGHLIDEAADAFLARVPWAIELCDELGLTPRLTEPAARSAFVWSRGELRRLPPSQLLGVPTDLDELAASGIVSEEGIARAQKDLLREGPAPVGDPSIGELLRDRLGDEVVDRLIGPLVGGINAGDVDRLSLRGCAAQIAGAADAGGSLIRAAAAIRARAAGNVDSPVFHAPLGGMTELVDTLAEALGPGVDLRTDAAVTALRPAAGRWLVGDEPEPFDHVVVTTPSPVAAQLLAASATAAATLAAIDYASVTMVTLAFDRSALDHELDGSGFLVPAVEQRFVTACSFASSKWDHIGSPDTVILRVSAGRDGDEVGATELGDDVLLDRMLSDLDDFVGVSAPPTEVRISRWSESLPQYRPGHLDRIDDLDAALADDLPGVAAAGAALRGLGVPACIQQGRTAVRSLVGR